MLIGRVLGSVVATLKSEGLAGVRFLLVQPLDDAGQPKGSALVAADATNAAAPGQLIHYEGGREAALALDPWFVPVDHAIVGLIDAVTMPGHPTLTDATPIETREAGDRATPSSPTGARKKK